MPHKKTITVADLVDRVNALNKNSMGPRAKGWREGASSLLERVLHDTGNYQGFGYLTADQIAPGELPGIVRNPDSPTGPHTFPDESRRVYYKSMKLAR